MQCTSFSAGPVISISAQLLLLLEQQREDDCVVYVYLQPLHLLLCGLAGEVLLSAAPPCATQYDIFSPALRTISLHTLRRCAC